MLSYSSFQYKFCLFLLVDRKMNSRFCGLFLALVFGIIVVIQCDIPSYIKVCPRSHPNISACIANSIEALRPLLKNGIEELGVPGLEPLKLTPLKIDTIGGGTRLATNITNLRAYGVSDFKILKLNVDLGKDTHRFSYDIGVEKLYIEADYELDSKILFLDLKGKGPMTINATGFSTDCSMTGRKIRRNNVNHLLFDPIQCNIVLGKTSVYLDNLFNGNAVLARATNDVINDNALILFEEIKPGLIHALTSTFTEISNKITLAFKYEDLFP